MIFKVPSNINRFRILLFYENIEDFIKIILFNITDTSLLKVDKNGLADELQDVGHVIRAMEKPTTRCLRGRSWGSGGYSSALGHQTVLVPRTLLFPYVFLSLLQVTFPASFIQCICTLESFDQIKIKLGLCSAVT